MLAYSFGVVMRQTILPRAMRTMTTNDRSVILTDEDKRREKREHINRLLTIAIKAKRAGRVVRLAKELSSVS